ncbi:hypothetical protein ACOT81_05215 [Streptomyces sp. WI04-05B]|uniref:hypothetical protein n=1 Tax=Streptomyces TaxID=1883 RepID=UPI0029B3A3CB|nr:MULTISPECIES: hypothetical protein [unclassified Streptomyces]MDX2546899.1 hypothetical protein [Streptomyces sp. WI04-05B]MDX2589284.1 hypothetical protein [Streptomyces sp. WI04-05A]
MTEPSAVPRPQLPSAAPLPLFGLAALRGRMLIQTRPERVGQVQEHLASASSGLILSGGNATAKALQLRDEGYNGVLLADPALYEKTAATEEAPFPQTEPDGFFLNDPLERSLEQQRAAGVTAPLTPTGYIQAEDSDALRAAVTRMTELDDPGVTFVVPIDVTWLRNEESLHQLIAYLQDVNGPKAIILGGQMDPLARYAKSVHHLRQLITQVPDTALLRTDLAAFGALAAGAAFTAFGATSSLRHTIVPGEKAQTGKKSGGPGSPHVLHPELMDFYLGETLAKKYAAAAAPICECYACGHKALDTFTSNQSPLPAEAAAHNIAVLMGWLRDLCATPPGIARQRWWYDRCRIAVDQYPLLNAALEQPKAFRAPKQLECWALADPCPVPAEPSPAQRTR